MEYACGPVKLKPGTEDKLEEWRRTISANLAEAAATLKDEDTQVESYFTIEIGGEKHLLGIYAQSRLGVCSRSPGS